VRAAAEDWRSFRFAKSRVRYDFFVHRRHRSLSLRPRMSVGVFLLGLVSSLDIGVNLCAGFGHYRFTLGGYLGTSLAFGGHVFHASPEFVVAHATQIAERNVDRVNGLARRHHNQVAHSFHTP
jgi:hypothetical protein